VDNNWSIDVCCNIEAVYHYFDACPPYWFKDTRDVDASTRGMEEVADFVALEWLTSSKEMWSIVHDFDTLSKCSNAIESIGKRVMVETEC
jgi:hypothetical protein